MNPGELYQDLRMFVHFNGGHNHIALVHLEAPGADGIRYALFEMLGVTGLLSWLFNGRQVRVRIWCDAATLTVVGDTAQKHMLIGQRRWQVTWSTHIKTEAYERPSGLFNRLGMRFAGRRKQVEVWRAYFQNILAALASRQVTGTITASSPQEVAGNPWEPSNPYPGCP